VTLKGRKQRNTIVLEVEPDLPDGTEVEVILPVTWEAEHDALLSIGYHPDFGNDIEKARNAWTPPQF